MTIWSAEIKELEKLYESFKGQLPDLGKDQGVETCLQSQFISSP